MSYTSEDLEIDDDGVIYFGGYKIEKRVHYPAIISLKNNEKFDVKNVYIATVNIGETMQ